MKLLNLTILALMSATPFVSQAEELSDLDNIFSAHIISVFTGAAECLSIKLSDEQKLAMISAEIASADMEAGSPMTHFKEMDKLLAMGEKDSEKIHGFIGKYCPDTTYIISEILKNRTQDEIMMMVFTLEEIVVSIASAQLLDDHTREKIFIYNRTPIGSDKSPF